MSERMGRFIKDVRRRRVLPNALLYIVAAWVTIQVADLAIDAHLALDEPDLAGELILKRLALAGRDQRTVEYLGRMQADAFSSNQVRRAMRADQRGNKPRRARLVLGTLVPAGLYLGPRFRRFCSV